MISGDGIRHMNCDLELFVGTGNVMQGNFVNGHGSQYGEQKRVHTPTYQMPPSSQPHHYHYQQQSFHSQQSAMHSSAHIKAHPSTYGTVKMQYPPSRNYNPMARLPQQFVTNNQYIQKQQQQPSVKNVNTLPSSKIPTNSPILWELSQEVREWKFLGRYLDLDEETIDEIDYNTVPNRTRDKSLKVLTEWVNSSTPTWEGLGKALLDAEYVMLYEKLLELIKKYALG